MPYWFVFHKQELLLERQDDGSYTIPHEDVPPTKINSHILDINPMTDGAEAKAYTIEDDAEVNSRYELCGLRQSYYKLPENLYLKAGQCHELIYWDKNTQYCGVCGAPMKMHTNISKKCSKCGKEIWPQKYHCQWYCSRPDRNSYAFE